VDAATPPPPGLAPPPPRRGPVAPTRIGATLVVAAFLAAALTEARLARDTITVTVIANRRSAPEREEARRRRDPRDDVAEIYGVPIGAPIDVVEPPWGRRGASIVPVEAPTRRLLALEDFPRHATPAAVRLVGWALALGLAVIGTAVVAFARRRRRRAAA